MVAVGKNPINVILSIIVIINSNTCSNLLFIHMTEVFCYANILRRKYREKSSNTGLNRYRMNVSTLIATSYRKEFRVLYLG